MTKCVGCEAGFELKRYLDGSIRHFDGMMAWSECTNQRVSPDVARELALDLASACTIFPHVNFECKSVAWLELADVFTDKLREFVTSERAATLAMAAELVARARKTNQFPSTELGLVLMLDCLHNDILALDQPSAEWLERREAKAKLDEIRSWPHETDCARYSRIAGEVVYPACDCFRGERIAALEAQLAQKGGPVNE